MSIQYSTVQASCISLTTFDITQYGKSVYIERIVSALHKRVCLTCCSLYLLLYCIVFPAILISFHNIVHLRAVYVYCVSIQLLLHY